MDIRKQRIIDLSDQILDHLLLFKESHPDFTFSLRSRDSVQSEEKRLSVGQWFQGSDYIYVPLFKRGDSARKIKTIGFQIGVNKEGHIISNFIEISFKAGVTNQNEIAFHRELADEIGISLNSYNRGIKPFDDPSDFITNLDYYTGEFRDRTIALLDKYNLLSGYVVTEKEFKKNLKRIGNFRRRLGMSPSSSIISSSQMEQRIALNQILYGPPGTGKTYELTQQFNRLSESSQELSRDEFLLEITKSLRWWETLAICLYQAGTVSVPELMEHEIIKARFGHTRGKIRPQRLWSPLQIHTVEECDNVQFDLSKRANIRLFIKENDSKWRLHDRTQFENDYPDLVNTSLKIQEGPVSEEYKKRYIFTTCHQSLTYEDFIEGIKPYIPDDEERDDDAAGIVSYEIQKGIFYNACDEAARLAGFASLLDALDDTKELRSQRFESSLKRNRYFTIFLDEINRANIAATFGELITLLEPDKRLGMVNEVIIDQLPYSKKPFGVPPNLRVIGTMNTADRSVEALDSALRRRFSFKEMMPAYNLPELNYDIADHKAYDILKTINGRIERLLNRDHLIGHSYFINTDNIESSVFGLQVFYDKVIPLLQEYFFGDYSKIGLILGQGFVESKPEDKIAFATFEDDDIVSRSVYEIVDHRKEEGIEGFKKAIKTLMPASD